MACSVQRKLWLCNYCGEEFIGLDASYYVKEFQIVVGGWWIFLELVCFLDRPSVGRC